MQRARPSESSSELRALFESLPDVVARFGADAHMTAVNQRWRELTGQAREDALDLGYLQMFHPDDAAILEHAIGTLEPGGCFVEQMRMRGAAGDVRWVQVRIVPYEDGDGRIVGTVATVRDVTDDVRLRRERDRLADVLDASPDPTVITDSAGYVLYANASANSLLGAGRRYADLLSAASARVYEAEVLPTADRFGLWSGELAYHLGADQSGAHAEIPVSVLVTVTRDDRGDVLEISHTSRDITPLKEAERQLTHLATHDNLTGLANRTLLVGHLERCAIRCRTDGTPMAVLFIDLDGFKAVNDQLGHDAGDDVLRVAARRIAASVRGDDLVARLGGDEFVIVCQARDARRLGCDIGQRVVTSIGEPIDLGGRQVEIGASVGIAIHDGRASVDDLLALADHAMYRAKQDGKGRLVVFDTASSEHAVR